VKPAVIFFDFGDTIGELRPPFHLLRRLLPAAPPVAGGGRLVTRPPAWRRLLRRPLLLAAARAYRAFPESAEVLSELRRRGYRLAICSNNSDIVLDQLQVTGLAGYFETVTYSEEAGAEKPHPLIFQVALRRMGVDASQAWHVGDSHPADMVGAQQAGLFPIWVKRGGEPSPESIPDLKGLLLRVG